MAKSICQSCKRNVMLVSIGGESTAFEPELIKVVRATSRQDPSADGPRIYMSNKIDYARRLHAERCEDYQNQARRERLSSDMRKFTARQARGNAKNRGL